MVAKYPKGKMFNPTPSKTQLQQTRREKTKKGERQVTLPSKIKTPGKR